MRILHSALIALIGALLALPAFAATRQQAATVTKTFTLTVQGRVPADRVFELRYLTQAALTAGGGPHVIHFCGPQGDQPTDQQVSTAACAGNGAVYTVAVALPQGSRLAYQYFTLLARDPQGTFEVFAASFQGQQPDGPEDFEPVTARSPTSAIYGAGAAPAQLPTAGARASIGLGQARGWIAVSLGLLLLGGYAWQSGRVRHMRG